MHEAERACERMYGDGDVVTECQHAVKNGHAFFQRNGTFHLSITGSEQVSPSQSQNEQIKDVYTSSAMKMDADARHADKSDLEFMGASEGSFVLPDGSSGYLED